MPSPLREALATSPTELAKRTDLAPVHVIVLDSGVDGTHPDLQGRITAAYTSAETEEGEPTVLEMDPEENSDTYGHGTSVCSIIARIAPNTTITSVRVLGGDNMGKGELLLEGVKHAVGLEGKVVNMSLAVASKFVPLLTPLCEQAYYDNKIIVAARRNAPLHNEGFPAALVPCVGVDNREYDTDYAFEWRGEVIEYAARGIDIPSAAMGGGYTTVTGTSFATPTMSGLVSLMCGAWPDITPFEVKAILKAWSLNEQDEKAA